MVLQIQLHQLIGSLGADIYQTCFPKDRISFKLLVWGLFVWEWVQMGLVTQTYFEIYVYDYGSIASMTSYHATWFTVPIMSAIVAFVVQCFFVWRIWVFSRSKILTGMILSVRPSLQRVIHTYTDGHPDVSGFGGAGDSRWHHCMSISLRFTFHGLTSGPLN